MASNSKITKEMAAWAMKAAKEEAVREKARKEEAERANAIREFRGKATSTVDDYVIFA